MLEGVVSSLLERLLGEFVEGFDANNVNLSLFSTKSGIGKALFLLAVDGVRTPIAHRRAVQC